MLKCRLPDGVAILAFADDIIILITAKMFTQMQLLINVVLKIVLDWANLHKLTFNIQKSSYMIFTRQRQQPILNVQLNGEQIQKVNTLKYLGVTIDNKLNWNSHIDRLETKLIRLINNLSIAARATWGLQTTALTILYKGAIFPMLTYGINVWYTGLDKKHNLRRLQRVQRLMAIKIIKGFRTVSYDAACILAKIVPIHLIAKQYVTQYELLTVNGNNYCGSQVEKPVSKNKWLHPASIPVVHITAVHAAEIMIFTDGSKYGENVGCATVVFEHDTLTTVNKFRLGSHCTNNQAEQYAIHRALQHIKQYPNTVNVCIVTDSKSTLQKLANPKDHDPIIEQIRLDIIELNQTSSTQVTFSWVKSHIGILGNELADIAAKSAAKDQLLPESYSQISKTHLHYLLHTKTINHWQQHWDNTTNGQHLKQYIPNINSYIKNKQITTDFFTTQLLTGHGPVNAYFYRFKIRTSPVCECDFYTEQTYRHLLYDCRLLRDIRETLRQQVTRQNGVWPVDEPTLLMKHHKALRQFATDLHEAMRSWHAHYD